MKNPLSKGIKNTDRQFRCNITCMFEASVATNDDIPLYIQYGFPLNNPTQFLTDANSWTSIPNIGTTWDNLLGGGALFDQYRVMALTVKFIPNLMQVQNIGSTVPTYQHPSLMYGLNDKDEINQMPGTGVAIEQKFLNSGSPPRSYVTGRPITFRYIQPKASRKYWCNAQSYNDNPNATGGSTVNSIKDMPNKAAGMKHCHILNVGTETLGTYYFGRYYITWDVIFRSIYNQY